MALQARGGLGGCNHGDWWGGLKTGTIIQAVMGGGGSTDRPQEMVREVQATNVACEPQDGVGEKRD